MFISLFSIFDPYRSSVFRNWIIIAIPLFWYKQNIKSFNNLFIIGDSVLKVLLNEIKIILGVYFFQHFLLIPLFIGILILNLRGLLPFVFPLTRHLCITLSFSLSLWLSLIIIYFTKYITLLSHLVPYGCPTLLIPFIVIIESIRILIRPLTLSVRLSANIIAGHIIIILVRLAAYRKFSVFTLRLLVEMIIRVLEIAVALIQPYVFYILLILYALEMQYHL